MDEQSRSRFRPKAPQTGPLPKDRGTKPLTPKERLVARETNPDHWQKIEGYTADIRGVMWAFRKEPSVDHIDLINSLIDDMSESWEKIAPEELEKLTELEETKIKETTDKDKLQARFEEAFNTLLPKEWNELSHLERVKIYDKLFTAHTALKEIGTYPIALLMQKARVARHNPERK